MRVHKQDYKSAFTKAIKYTQHRQHTYNITLYVYYLIYVNLFVWKVVSGL